MELSYKYDSEMSLIEFYRDSELIDTWCCDEEPLLMFYAFKLIFMAGYRHKLRSKKGVSRGVSNGNNNQQY